jgi:poly(3-hydroxybutyrate) depolymerase
MRAIRFMIIGVAMLAGSTVGVAAQEKAADSAPAVPSPGCSSPPVEPGTYLREQLLVGDTQKMWSMHVPEAYEGTNALPLWVDLHGVGGTGPRQISELTSSAEAHGFVVAAPTELLGNAGWTWREQDPVLDTSLSNPDIAVHGKADGIAYFDGGLAHGFNDFPVVLALAQTSIPERVTNVALRNRCQPEPAVEAIDDTMERWTWACPAGAEVELIAHIGGHYRPQKATELIWAFLEQHPMP